jgi:hypothetical protein
MLSGRVIVNDELKKVIKSAMDCFKHQPLGTEKNYKHLSCYICLAGLK